eukprot:1887346-Pleurochrysis_carterae.AAC.1
MAQACLLRSTREQIVLAREFGAWWLVGSLAATCRKPRRQDSAARVSQKNEPPAVGIGNAGRVPYQTRQHCLAMSKRNHIL